VLFELFELFFFLLPKTARFPPPFCLELPNQSTVLPSFHNSCHRFGHIYAQNMFRPNGDGSRCKFELKLQNIRITQLKYCSPFVLSNDNMLLTKKYKPYNFGTKIKAHIFFVLKWGISPASLMHIAVLFHI
jgi:hypothetical protein